MAEAVYGLAKSDLRRTELEQTGLFTNHALNEWFGHSGAVAELHYLQVTESDFHTAASLNLSARKATDTFSDTSEGEQGPPKDSGKQKNPRKTGVVMAANGSGYSGEYTGATLFVKTLGTAMGFDPGGRRSCGGGFSCSRILDRWRDPDSIPTLIERRPLAC